MIFLNGLSINQLEKESNSLKSGSQAVRVNTHRAMDKEKLSKMPKANYKIIKNLFSFLMKSFY